MSASRGRGPDPRVVEWAMQHAVPVSFDASVVSLPARIHGASVVGVASAVRSARELVLATHLVLRSVVTGAGPGEGIRAVFIEGTDEPFNTAAELDHWVTTGNGDLGALLRASQGFLHHAEAMSVLEWLRRYAIDHPEDPVRVVHDRTLPQDAPQLVEIERRLARRNLDWHARTGQRVAHWGGTAHLVAAAERHLPEMPEETHRNAGGHLRAALGTNYAVVALTIGAGTVPFRVPLTPSDFTESVLGGVGTPVLLALDGLVDAPEPVRDWFRRPLRTRAIGPHYQSSRDDVARVDAGPADESVDAIVYVPSATVVSPLRQP